jgi:hypothetical protein
MPDLGRYKGVGEWVDDVPAFGTDFQRDCDGSCTQWLHQMWSDLGRLAAFAEILQVGRILAPSADMLGVEVRDGILP